MILQYVSIYIFIAIWNTHALTRNAYGRRSALQSQRTRSLSLAQDGRTNFYGPEQNFEEMIAGVQNAELGIDIMVGSSTIPAAGLGVFACLSEGIEQSDVKMGTPLVGYSKGTFIDQAEDVGDKTVAFFINRPNAAVFFEKEFMTAKDAIGLVADRHDLQEMENVLLGHKIFYDSEAQDIAFTPDESFLRRYFVPHEVAATLCEDVDIDEAKTEGVSPDDVYYGIDVSNMGMYVNDLAYFPGISESHYRVQSAEKNSAAIVWRLEDSGGVLVPTWPVVVSTKHLVFTNTSPMELGLEYNYKYWAAAEAKEKEKEKEKEGGE